MEDKNSSGPIPDGWDVKTERQKDGSEIPCYWCPRSGQHFYTYKDMMRYVEYAQKNQLSIYSPDFQTMKIRKKANWSHKGNRTIIAPRRSHFLGESSKTLPSYRVTFPEESSDLEERTTLSNPEDSTESTNTGKDMEASQAGIDKEPEILSSDLEALVIGIEKLSLC
ncbi:uncharacterized protein LOC133715123 isoform X1 [Rosa rugosa]|uniref:uncharacterized protein LOC133715123 isoform X1 n=1 Tax=Rosa rugosa TaxID=74645 RepID=UPI002B404789|nr:uncharacterized protein LOC133715123 isoform X1 [Rosa rugosa]